MVLIHIEPRRRGPPLHKGHNSCNVIARNINGRQETHTDRSKLALMMDKHRVQCVAGTFNYKFNIMANLLQDNPHQGDGSNQATCVSPSG